MESDSGDKRHATEWTSKRTKRKKNRFTHSHTNWVGFKREKLSSQNANHISFSLVFYLYCCDHRLPNLNATYISRRAIVFGVLNDGSAGMRFKRNCKNLEHAKLIEIDDKRQHSIGMSVTKPEITTKQHGTASQCNQFLMLCYIICSLRFVLCVPIRCCWIILFVFDSPCLIWPSSSLLSLSSFC